MPADAVSLLREIPLFRQMGLAGLYLIAGIGLEEHIPAGTTLGIENEPLLDLWVILEGTVAVNSPATGAAESYLDGPTTWGSAALVEPYTSFGTAVAATDCRVLRLPTVDVRELAARNPRLGVRLYEEFASSIFVRLQRLIDESLARSGPRPPAGRPTEPVPTPGLAPELGSAPPDAIGLMRRAPLLDHLQPDQLRLLYALGMERQLSKGTVLGYGGRVLESVWVILEGEVEIDTPLSRGASILQGPETWGTASLVPPFKPNGTAVTRTACRVVQIGSADIRTLIEQSPRLGVDLYLALATNVFRRIRILTNAAARAREQGRG